MVKFLNIKLTQTITETTTSFSKLSRPWPVEKILKLSSRYTCITPVTIETIMRTPEMRVNPRTALSKSASPGALSTVRESKSNPPSHIPIANAWAIPKMYVKRATCWPIRVRPKVAIITVMRVIAGTWVAGSKTRAGWNVTQNEPTTRAKRNSNTKPAASLSVSSQLNGLSELTNVLSELRIAVMATIRYIVTEASNHVMRKKRKHTP